MILCIDVGNTHIYGGLYINDKLELQFRYPSSSPFTSDQFGVFLKMFLREHELSPKSIKKVAICSVVPSLNYTIRSAFLKYFFIDPVFLNVDHAKELIIQYKNPHEIGADRISNALAAIRYAPNKNLIIIDLGTATTFDIITANKQYMGGVIFPGMSISMRALSENTAKLSAVTIVRPQHILGQSTVTNIQAGLYYSHLGAIREISSQITETIFNNETPIIIGTGGFANLFEKEKIFTAIIPELVLQGLYILAQEAA